MNLMLDIYYIYMNMIWYVPGVPAGLLFLLLILVVPFSKHENGSEEGSEEQELLANMSRVIIPPKALFLVRAIN